MKKVASIVLGILMLSTICCNAEVAKRSHSISKLGIAYENDFENLVPGGVQKELFVESGQSNIQVVEMDGNKFLRHTNYDNRGANAIHRLPYNMSGQIIIEFDIRMQHISLCDIPTIYGITKDGTSNIEIARFRITENGTIQVNQTQTLETVGNRSIMKWNHVVIMIDTDRNVCYMNFDGRSVGVFDLQTPTKKISRINFSSRREGQMIDFDNLQIYNGEIENLSIPGSKGEASSAGIPMPIRYKREMAMAYKTETDIKIDGKLDEKDWGLCKVYDLDRIAQGNPFAKASFVVMRDDDGIYVGVWIYDSILNDIAPEDQGWLRDQVEIYIDGNHSHNRFYDQHCRQYSYGYKQAQPDELNVSQKRMGNGMQYAQALTEDGWTVELYIPFSAFSDKEYNVGDIIGFDVGYNDSNKANVRSGQLVWRGTQNNSTITNAFGDLQIVEGFVGESNMEADIEGTTSKNY